jgi:hypothetical protein
VTGDLLEVTDEKGSMACGGEQKTGTYKWKLEGKSLIFTKVQDECGGRANAMTGKPGYKSEEVVASSPEA